MQANKDGAGDALFKYNISRQGAADFVLAAASFLAARALVFDVASPFVLAYISAFLFRGGKFYVAAFFGALGIVSSFRGEFSVKYLLAIILLCAVNLFLSIRPRAAAGVLQAAAAAAAALVAGLVLAVFRRQEFYFIALNFLEAILIFALGIVLGKALACAVPKAKRGPLVNEELIAIGILAGVLAVGAADVAIWHFSMRYFFAMLIVLLAASSGGGAIGAVCGLFLGFMLNISGFEYIYFAVLLGLVGFGAGSARAYGRLASFGVFVLVGLLCALYFDITLLSLSTMLSVAAAGAAFYFLPKGFLLNIHAGINPATGAGGREEYAGRVKELVLGRIVDFGMGYGKLADVFEKRTPDGVVARQFAGVAATMEAFGEEVAASLNFRRDLEDKLIREFSKLGFEAESVAVSQSRAGRFEVCFTGKNRGAREIGTIISQALGKKMALTAETRLGHSVRLTYCQQAKFCVQSGVDRANKAYGRESGDSFSLLQLTGGRFVAALSDGMGSGARAREESEAAIELLEELMERGFQKDIAVSLINSALLTKSDEEFFATLDICLLDTDSGMAEFVKIGAARSYLIRRGKVEAIGCWTLPAGILEAVDVDVQSKQLRHGDIVVMITDGVADSAKGAWMEDLLENLPVGSVQETAEHVLAAARENWGGEILDDMTVLVLRMLETRN